MGYPRPFTTLNLRLNISEPMASQPAYCVLYMTLFWLVVCLKNTCYEYIHVMYVNIITKKLFKILKWIWSTRLSSPLIMGSFMRWIHFTCFVKFILVEHWYLKHSIFLYPLKILHIKCPSRTTCCICAQVESGRFWDVFSQLWRGNHAPWRRVHTGVCCWLPERDPSSGLHVRATRANSQPEMQQHRLPLWVAVWSVVEGELLSLLVYYKWVKYLSEIEFQKVSISVS